MTMLKKKRSDRRSFTTVAASGLALSLLGGCLGQLDDDPDGTITATTEALHGRSNVLRAHIARQVGGIRQADGARG